MGIRSWFGLDTKDEPEPTQPPPKGPPTTEELLAALAGIEQQARDGHVPGVVMSRLVRVTRTVRDTLPRLADLGLGSAQGYSVMATATDYLPVAIGNYLRLPREWADTRPIADGKSSVMLLVDQLDLLGRTMDQIFDAVLRRDAEAIVIHGAFLESKFGAQSAGGVLGLGAPQTDLDAAHSASAPSLGSSEAGPGGREHLEGGEASATGAGLGPDTGTLTRPPASGPANGPLDPPALRPPD